MRLGYGANAPGGPAHRSSGSGIKSVVGWWLAPLILLPFATGLLTALFDRIGGVTPALAVTAGTSLAVVVLIVVLLGLVQTRVPPLRPAPPAAPRAAPAPTATEPAAAPRPSPEPAGSPEPATATAAPEAAATEEEEAAADEAAPRPTGAEPADLAETNRELMEANQRLERLAATKDDLMSLISHELSQPLSSIASLAELLTDGWHDLDDDTRLDLATRIDNNGRRLTRMLADMLLLFHLESGNVTARRTPVVITEVLEMVAAAQPEDLELSIMADPDASALVDRDHLRQVVNHLLANAARHGQPPVEMHAYRREGEVVVAVRDHGSGIPATVVPRLFERSIRGRGSGMGLVIVRHLVTINGGRIWYESAAPHGARLLVALEPVEGSVSRADRAH